ncbi:MAG: 23S rRNA (adenine(2503)-C(2))-methyltransferase RlmN, partial [Candidatus Omnitrophica bacterium]|nr:23S rRNA (adenine(2503)-C(2))-methyltransferase RlmN [Candidatus Omnitrophota bacterium]
MDKHDIKNYTLQEFEKAVTALGEPAYRARQIFSWIYKKGVTDLKDMKNIPPATAANIGRQFCAGRLTLARHLRSGDRTEKFAFELDDKQVIESVVIPGKDRKTACLSSQAGCKIGCAFCASGRCGFRRDLTAAEILGQILYIQYNVGGITNYVFMGMGEPLDNFDNVARAIRIMNDPGSLGIGSRRITVSTCGIVPGIEKLSSLDLQINLSISLHATTDELRDRLVPVNRKYPLDRLIDACLDYEERTGRMITLEYVLLAGVNDSVPDAERLGRIAAGLHAKVN